METKIQSESTTTKITKELGINEVELTNTWNKITSKQIQSRTKKLFII